MESLALAALMTHTGCSRCEEQLEEADTVQGECWWWRLVLLVLCSPGPPGRALLSPGCDGHRVCWLSLSTILLSSTWSIVFFLPSAILGLSDYLSTPELSA